MSTPYNRKDKYYQQAKREGYRSRAAYKLLELHEHYNLMRSGGRVLDLGCWPGGWLQVAASLVGSSGLVVGIDLVAVEPLNEPQVKIFCGDARDEGNIELLRASAPEGYDLVLSDMSPKLTGIKEADQAGTVACAELAFFIAEKQLRLGGSLVVKVFKGNDTELWIRSIRPRFRKIVRTELDSSRNTSNEFYFVGMGYQTNQQATKG